MGGGHVGENIWGYMGTSVPLKDFSEFRVAAHCTLPKLDDPLACMKAGPEHQISPI